MRVFPLNPCRSSDTSCRATAKTSKPKSAGSGWMGRSAAAIPVWLFVRATEPAGLQRDDRLCQVKTEAHFPELTLPPHLRWFGPRSACREAVILRSAV